jgi:hypothetical protein
MEDASGLCNLTSWNRHSLSVFVRAWHGVESSVTLNDRLGGRSFIATLHDGELSVFLQVRNSRKLLLPSVAAYTAQILDTAGLCAELAAAYTYIY